MSAKKPSRKGTQGSGQRFTEDERAAVREWVRESRARRGGGREEGERELLSKIATMQESDRVMAERLHALVKANAPALSSRTWYGMPAYAKNDRVVCFFQPAQKFKTRYATFGFSDEASLDDGQMWPTSFALASLTAAEEVRIAALLKRALG